MARASSNLRNAIKSSKFHSPLYSPFDHQLDNLIARLDRLRASPTHTQFRKFPHHRGKRFVITAIAAGLAAISLGASIYTALETSTLAARTNSLKSAQLSEVLQMEHLALRSTNLDEVVWATQEVLARNVEASAELFWISNALTHLKDNIEIAERAFSAGSAGRLDIATLRGIDLTKTFSEVGEYANTNGKTLISHEPTHLLNLPTTISSHENGFKVFTHIPIVDPATVLTLFQHTPLPIRAAPGVFFSLSTQADSIAISEDEQLFRVTTMMELLADCTKIGDFFACPRGNAARRLSPNITAAQDPGLCLHGLLTNHADRVHASCDMDFVRPGPAVYQTSARAFATYGRTSGNITCRSGTATTFTTTDFGSIHLPPGCSATTDRFQLSSSDSAYTRDEQAWVGTSPTSLNTSVILRHFNVDELHRLSTLTRSIGDDLKKISFSEAKRILGQPHPFVAPFLHPSFGLAAMAGYIALAWHIISFFLHRRTTGLAPIDPPPAYPSASAPTTIPVPDFKLGN